MEALHERALQIGAGLVVIDVLPRWANFEDGAENDSDKIKAAIGLLAPLVADNIAVVILHHATWSAKRSRGSTDIVGAVDHQFFIEGEGSEDRKIENRHGRLPIEWEGITLRSARMDSSSRSRGTSAWRLPPRLGSRRLLS